MARPRGRGGPGKSRGSRGGGYSSRSAGPKDGGARGGGVGQGPLIAVIAIGGVLAIVLLIILLTKGGSDEPYVPPVTDPTPKATLISTGVVAGR